MVLGTHILTITKFGFLNESEERISVNFWQFGSFGVTGFFVLSAYLLSSNLSHELRIREIDLHNFYMKRLLRIAPLYFLVLLTNLLYNFIIKVDSSYNNLLFQNILLAVFSENWFGTSFTQTSMVTHFWSVCVEVQFYLLLPLVFKLSRSQIRRLCFVLIVVTPFIRIIILDNFSYPAVWNFTFSHTDSFALGIFIAVSNFEISKLPKLKNILKLVGIILLSILISCSFVLGEKAFAGFQASWTYLLVAACFGLSIILAGGQTLKSSPFVSALEYIGTRSYGLYVFHWPILFIFRKYLTVGGMLNPLQALFVFIITFLISHVSYKYFESYFLRKKKSLK